MVNPENLRIGDALESPDGVLFHVGSIDGDFVNLEYKGHKYGAFKMYGKHSRAFWAGSRLMGSLPKDATGVGGPQKAPLPGHPRFLALLERMREMHASKSGDYGDEADTFANYKRASRLGVRPSLGIAIRLEDKVARLEKFFTRGTLNNESVYDSLLDLANYAIGIHVLLEEEATANNGHAEKNPIH